jgi:hypothetical protein
MSLLLPREPHRPNSPGRPHQVENRVRAINAGDSSEAKQR